MIESIRQKRNRFSHHDIAIDSDFAYDFIHQISMSCAQLNTESKSLTKIVSFPFAKKVFVFNHLGESIEIEERELWTSEVNQKREKDNLGPSKLGVLGYRIGGKTKSNFIASAHCPECSGVSPQYVASQRTHCPSKCRAFTVVEGEWGSIVRKAGQALEKGNVLVTEKKRNLKISMAAADR